LEGFDKITAAWGGAQTYGAGEGGIIKSGKNDLNERRGARERKASRQGVLFKTSDSGEGGGSEDF